MRRFGFLLLFLATAPAFSAQSAEASGVVNSARANVRGSASLSSEVVTQLHKDDKVTILEEIVPAAPKPGEPKKWLKIAMPANTPLWVHSDFVDADTKKVKPKKLKIRGGAGEQFSMVGVLEQGADVKPIRVVEGWTEIETPPGAYAFIAADLVTLPQPAPEPAPTTQPVVTKQVTEDVAVAKAQPATTTTVTETVVKNEVITPPVVAPAVVPVVTPPPAVVTPVPVPTPAPEVIQPAAAVEVPIKRIVSREGILRRARNIQAPSYYSLEEVNGGQMINYVDPKPLNAPIGGLVGVKVLVTGEEIVDPRWPNMPIIVTENLRLVP